MFEKLLTSLIEVGPYVGGMVLVYSLMLGMAKKRRAARATRVTDEVVLRTGQYICILLGAAAVVDLILSHWGH